MNKYKLFLDYLKKKKCTFKDYKDVSSILGLCIGSSIVYQMGSSLPFFLVGTAGVMVNTYLIIKTINRWGDDCYKSISKNNLENKLTEKKNE